MRVRSWYVIAGTGVLVAIAFAGCTAWVSREAPPILDAAGTTQEIALEASLPEQYSLAAQRYRTLNELVTETQLEVHPGEWNSSASTGLFMTLRGDAISSALRGHATAENSYYLEAFWRLENVDAPESLLKAAQEYWATKGWATSKDESQVSPGSFRVTATAEDGTWIALSMVAGDINLTAFSGVYWGDQEALADAIWNIIQHERDEGTGWQPERVDAEGNGVIRPGEYAPYPNWDPIGYAPGLGDLPLSAQ